MDNRYEIAEQNGMSREFADWFFDNKKAGCGNVWFMMMAAMWEGWQGRAAMLQGAEQQNRQQNIPENIPANTPCKQAPEHIWLQTAGVWPENGEFSELTWCSDNQHPDDTLYVRADVVSGNSPVIPDGLRLALSNAGIAAPESDEMLAATCEKHIQALVTWVKDRKPFQPAAPLQEV
jgi:hypothetical protein